LSKYTPKNFFKMQLYEQGHIRSLSGLQTSKLN
jgi:hypothetical protein